MGRKWTELSAYCLLANGVSRLPAIVTLGECLIDWLEAQITHINLDQAKPQEVFLPYLVMPNQKTLYETMEENRFLLPEGVT